MSGRYFVVDSLWTTGWRCGDIDVVPIMIEPKPIHIESGLGAEAVFLLLIGFGAGGRARQGTNTNRKAHGNRRRNKACSATLSGNTTKDEGGKQQTTEST